MSVGGLTGFAGVADWMVDTFIYTGVLIGVVLLLRRPVMRHFGPQLVYALWLLPLLRFVMPPIVLPAWMAPAEPVPEVAAAGTEPLMVILSEAPAESGVAAAAAPEVGLTVTELLLPLWLVGALFFLGWRVRDYVRMRRDLLADARPVGESGKVRLVETPAVSAPVAFGIRDKVVALPVDFMGRIDARARDMAIAHELEHHRGHDLLANIAAQPLLALHWFNPLAWWGWRAMRRDQEAACDARVVAGRARPERAAYAEVIAGFAAGQHLALAAPMACPVLGEKSIIHRLRSLTMDDISTRRRRLGIAAITTTALALPLTASITYAQPDTQEAQDRVLDADEVAMIDESPWLDQMEDPDTEDTDIVERNGDRTVVVRIRSDENGERRIIERSVRVGDGPLRRLSDSELERVLELYEDERDASELQEEELERELERAFDQGETAHELAEAARELAEVEREVGRVDSEARREVMRALAESRRAAAEASAHARASAREARATAMQARAEADSVRVISGEFADEMHCNGEDVTVERKLADGRRAIMICQSGVNHAQMEGLRAAMEAIRNNPSIPAGARREAFESIREAMEELREARGTGAQVIVPAPPAPPSPPRVTARFTGYVAPAASATLRARLRAVPMVNPLTGRLMAPQAEQDCDDHEEHAGTRATHA